MTTKKEATGKTKSRASTAKVLIVDDHPVVREGLALRISTQPDLQVCGEAEDVNGAMKLFAETKPDVAIVDLSLKSGSGIELIKRLKVKDSTVRILVWSMHDENLYAERALRAGALGYINKENATERIIEAIRCVLGGKVYLSDQLAARLLTRAVGNGAKIRHSPIEALSDRELEVFQFMGNGLDTQQIADKMHLSPKTVETYRTRIKEKLHVAKNAELIQRAVQWSVEVKSGGGG
jgi:DNA-binding NarL/FixJ family response regulator